MLSRGAEIPEFEFFEPFKSRLGGLINRDDRIQILKKLREESGREFAIAKQRGSPMSALPEAISLPSLWAATSNRSRKAMPRLFAGLALIAVAKLACAVARV